MEPKRLFDFIHYQKEKYPQAKALGHKQDGNWVYYSTDEIISKANKVSRGLIKLGLQPGDKVALATYVNRVEWSIMDIGISQAGLINVPVYPTISPREYEYIFNDSEVKYAFIGAQDLFYKVEAAMKNSPHLKGIYTLDQQGGIPYWEEMFSDEGQDEVEKRMANCKPEDLATLIYTSGTTGNPKGVMLSHNNIVSNVTAVRDIMPIGAGQRVLSFLPLCHIFERCASYAYVYLGINIVYTATDNLGGETGDLQAIKPHFFTTVPRLLEKVYEKIYNKGLMLTGIKKKLFFWALGLTSDYTYAKNYTGINKLKVGIADKLIFSKWREALGGNIVGILTGAAPCPAKMAQVFSAAGIPIREGYGLTETSPGLAINQYTKTGAMLGTVGPALKNVNIMIDASDGSYKDDEGEVLAKGPNIMMGYYNNPEKTAEVFKEVNGEKWFCTGDIGKFVQGSDGTSFLKITDRKKELLKTSGGKYVAPAPIESKLKENFLIEQAMVVGDKQKFVSALIIPAKEPLSNWCKENNVNFGDMDTVLNDPKVIAKYQEAVDEINPDFSHIEQIKKFKLLNCEWEPAKQDGSDSELTPTLKLKRRVIRTKFEEDINTIYNA